MTRVKPLRDNSTGKFTGSVGAGKLNTPQTITKIIPKNFSPISSESLFYKKLGAYLKLPFNSFLHRRSNEGVTAWVARMGVLKDSDYALTYATKSPILTYRLWAARQPGLSTKHADTLAFDREIVVRKAIVANPSISEEIRTSSALTIPLN